MIDSALTVTMELKAWAICPESMSMEEFLTLMQELGNVVLEVDEKNKKVMIAQEKKDVIKFIC